MFRPVVGMFFYQFQLHLDLSCTLFMNLCLTALTFLFVEENEERMLFDYIPFQEFVYIHIFLQCLQIKENISKRNNNIFIHVPHSDLILARIGSSLAKSDTFLGYDFTFALLDPVLQKPVDVLKERLEL